MLLRRKATSFNIELAVYYSLNETCGCIICKKNNRILSLESLSLENKQKRQQISWNHFATNQWIRNTEFWLVFSKRWFGWLIYQRATENSTNRKIDLKANIRSIQGLRVNCHLIYCQPPLCKIPYFYLISWCGNFVERHSFRIVSGESPKTMRKLSFHKISTPGN